MSPLRLAGPRRLRRGVALTAATATVAALLTALTVGAPAARADTAPASGTPATVAADALPTVQVDGVVWAQVIVGDTVYATGEFTSARPAGAAEGTQETTRSNILAYDLATGDLITSWAPSLNAQGLAIAASTDGSRIFVAGDFTQVSGANRYRMVALDATTGDVVSTFTPSFDARARALTVVDNTVYIGGIFTTASGQARTRLAAVNATSGALLSWAPSADAEVMALTAPPGTNKIIAGGRFDTLNGTSAVGTGALDATSGATLSWPANTVVHNSGTATAITSLTSDAAQVYGTGYTFGSGGNLEGSFAASSDTGQISWVNGCKGDSYDAAVAGDVLYTVSHAHDCGMIMGNPQTSPWTYQRAQAMTAYAAPDGRVNTYGNFPGVRASELLHWLPTLTGGSYTGQSQAAWDVAANGDYVVLGGEFPRVNGTAQQGLVRFAVRSTAPNDEGPRGYSDLDLTLDGITAGTVRASFKAAWDRDNQQLTYELLRGPKLSTATVVASRKADSTWWSRPTLALVDPAAPGGTTQSYRLRVTDPLGNSFVSPTLTESVPTGTSTAFGDYANTVLGDGATNYWRLGESSGTTGYNFAALDDLNVTSSATRGTAGAISGDPNTATTFPGTWWTVPAAGSTEQAGPQLFTEEAWFKTSTQSGGKIIGFGNSRTGSSSQYDRHVYMTDNGRLVFGVYQGGTITATSTDSYNDDAWHHVAAQAGPSGMKLYVDGALVAENTAATGAESFDGYWRIGGDRVSSGWPSSPSSSNFAGAIDEVATYPSALTAAQIEDHYQVGQGQVANQDPTASFTASTSSLTVSVDGSASSDPDGSIASYAWDFGDGATGTGATATHTYASAGTYTVTLTVTDDASGTGSTTRQVTVSESTDLAADAFGRTVSTGFGTADTGGAWDVSGAGTAFSVDGSTGRLSVPRGRSGTALLTGVSSDSTDVTNTYVVDQDVTGGGLYLGTIARSTSGGDYRVRVKLQSDGSVQIMAGKMTGGTNTVLGSRVTVAGLTYTTGTKLHVRVQATGTSPTTIRGRVWADGTTEPSTWQVSTTDSSSGLQAAGGVGIYAYLSGSATTTPVLIHTDDLEATDPSGANEPGNQDPTASFTASTSSLTVSVDGSASSDPDGSIASYAWDFGDGATGTGATATHTYASAGTYTVTLTVTDDASGTGSTTRQVTVSESTDLAADAFGRTVSTGFGTADTGGAWDVSGAGTAFSVDGSTGRLSVPRGRSGTALLTGVSSDSTDVTNTYVVDQDVTGGGLYLGTIARSTSGGDYRVRVKLQSDGSVQIMAGKMTGGTNTVLGSRVTVAGLTYTTGTKLHVRVQATGTSPTTIRGRVWADGTTEPSTWQVSTTDSSSGLQAAGGVGIYAYLSGSATTTPVLIHTDDLEATAA